MVMLNMVLVVGVKVHEEISIGEGGVGLQLSSSSLSDSMISTESVLMSITVGLHKKIISFRL